MFMTRRRNKQLVRRYYEEVWNQEKLDVVDELFASDYCTHNPLPGRSSGREGVTELVSALRASTPNLRCGVEYMVAEGDKVAARITLRGTCESQVDGISLPGQLTISALNVFRVKKRKIVEQWSCVYGENAALYTHKRPATTGEGAAGADEHGDRQLRIETARARSNLQSKAVWMILGLSVFLALGGFITAWLMLQLNHDFTGGWTSVVTALLAGVAFVVLVAASLNRSGGDTNNSLPSTAAAASVSRESRTDQETQSEKESETGDKPEAEQGKQAEKDSGEATIAEAPLSPAREPAIYIVVATAIAQLLIIYFLLQGAEIDDTQQAAIIAGLTALAGVVIRSRVTPVKPKGYAKVGLKDTSPQ